MGVSCTVLQACISDYTGYCTFFYDHHNIQDTISKQGTKKNTEAMNRPG